MKVSIIGCGHVGTSIAFAIVTKGLCQDLVLVNRTRRKAEGEAVDLQHAAAFGSRAMRVTAGEIADTFRSDVVVVTMSAPRDPNHQGHVARTSQAKENAAIIRTVMPQLVAVSPDAVFIIVTNPVDAMTFIAWQSSGLPPGRVMGTGTLIDSARFRSYLSEHMRIHPDDIRAYVLGEHGDTQFPALSVAATGGERLDSDAVIHRLFEKTVSSAHEVYAIKGYTNYAIALATAMMIESVLLDGHRTLPVSTLIQGFHGVDNVCLSIPVVVSRQGVHRSLVPHFSDSEVASFKKCAAEVAAIIASL